METFLLSAQKSISETGSTISVDFNTVGLLKGKFYNEKDNTKAPNSSTYEFL